MTKRMAGILILFCAAMSASAQTFKTLVDFDSTNGAFPGGLSLQGSDGNLYGGTGLGGTYDEGTVFQLATTGHLTTLKSFGYEDGCGPGSLRQDSNGNFYGIAGTCGPYLGGTFFAIDPAGVFRRFYAFCVDCGEPSNPGSLITRGSGSFYGTSSTGGENQAGTVFEITVAGQLTTLYSFCPQGDCADGGYPEGLVEAANSDVYGLTTDGGANNAGTFFQLSPAGTPVTLYSFCSQPGCEDGSPFGGLIQATDGNFYGTTGFGGANAQGSVFRLTPEGQFSTIYSFCSLSNCVDGYRPRGGVIQGSDGNLYGSTNVGGADSYGTIYRLSAEGHLTTLHSFHFRDGEFAESLLQSTNGVFYGTTSQGGTFSCFGSGCGTIFSLSVGLGPFVTTQTRTGNVGSPVAILGNNLTGSTGVSFNGTPAKFDVISDTEIIATVPSGASTGFVTVTTPNGVLKSNTKFHAVP